MKTTKETIVELGQAFSDYANSQTVINHRKLNISLRVKQLRQEARLTHEEISDQTKIKKQTYSGYENGHNNIPIEALVRLANYYNVSMDYITCRSDNKKGIFAIEEIGKVEKLENEMNELKQLFKNAINNPTDK